MFKLLCCILWAALTAAVGPTVTVNHSTFSTVTVVNTSTTWFKSPYGPSNMTTLTLRKMYTLTDTSGSLTCTLGKSCAMEFGKLEEPSSVVVQNNSVFSNATAYLVPAESQPCLGETCVQNGVNRTHSSVLSILTWTTTRTTTITKHTHLADPDSSTVVAPSAEPTDDLTISTDVTTSTQAPPSSGVVSIPVNPQNVSSETLQPESTATIAASTETTTNSTSTVVAVLSDTLKSSLSDASSISSATTTSSTPTPTSSVSMPLPVNTTTTTATPSVSILTSTSLVPTTVLTDPGTSTLVETVVLPPPTTATITEAPTTSSATPSPTLLTSAAHGHDDDLAIALSVAGIGLACGAVVYLGYNFL